MTDAFDADVLIYAAAPDNPLGRRVAGLFRSAERTLAGIGSLLLLPEVLSRPIRVGAQDEIDALTALLDRLELVPVDRLTADVAASLGARYRLKAADAIHLATAVAAGADRFLTNNARDFPKTIAEIAVAYPSDLPAA